MKINKDSFISFMLAFFIFMTLNLPSLKLIYSTSLLNLLALGGLWGVGYFKCYILKRDGISLNSYKINYIMQLLLIWVTLFWITLLQNPSNFTFSSSPQFFSVVLFALGIVLFTGKSELKYVFLSQLVWGLLLAFSEATIGIPKDRDLGQNYLISGVPIALTIVMLFGYIYSKKSNKINKILALPLISILYLGLFSLNGRAPILFSIIVPLIIVFIGLFFEEVKVIKYLKLIAYPFIVIVILYILLINLPDNIVERLLRIFVSISDEPRVAVYLESFEIILNNPEGIGLLGYEDLGLGYPHNIFLEMVMAGGFVMVIPLLIFLIFITRNILHTIQYNRDGVIGLAMVLYLFVTWNVSFELSGSYMLFSCISIYIISSEDIAIERRQLFKPVIFVKKWNNDVIYYSNEEQMDR